MKPQVFCFFPLGIWNIKADNYVTCNSWEVIRQCSLPLSGGEGDPDSPSGRWGMMCKATVAKYPVNYPYSSSSLLSARLRLWHLFLWGEDVLLWLINKLPFQFISVPFMFSWTKSVRGAPNQTCWTTSKPLQSDNHNKILSIFHHRTFSRLL